MVRRWWRDEPIALRRPYGRLVPLTATLACLFLLLPVVFVVAFSQQRDGAWLQYYGRRA